MRIRRVRSLGVVAALFAATLPLIVSSPPAAVAVPNPVATNDATYTAFGRVFPDPQGCLRPLSGAVPQGVSPWAKGRVCTAQFLGYDEVLQGAQFLEQKFPRFVQVIRLDEAYDNPDYRSAGLPRTIGQDEDGQPQVLARSRRPLYLFKITDADSSVPEADREHFAYSLSIHGIERAGLEGGIRAMEDLVTWAACEDDAAAAPGCAVEGPFPKRIVETPVPEGTEVPTAGEVLERSVIYFVTPNPDGWHRGELGQGGFYFQRYNGNGVDLNRDWPTIGYTYRPYSPASEPETQAYADVLKDIAGTTSEGRFTGGIDLHGQLLANAFSFTLLGASEKDFRKNFSTVDQSLRAWRDQTQRLAWSPYIADANGDGMHQENESCPVRNVVLTSGNFPYCVADEWGSVMDTIGYQITGGFGDWIESPMGLGAVGIDNEMSMSHILPNVVYDPINEQMHIDGNKGLIYSQLASMLTEEDSDYLYRPPGKIGYVHDPVRMRVPASDRPQNPGFPAQNDIDAVLPCTGDLCDGGEFVMTDSDDPTLEFEVRGPNRGIWNGGITVEATFLNAQGVSPTGSIPNIHLETFVEQQWQTVSTSFIQGGQPDLYLQAAQTVSANDPAPGQWRVRVDSPLGLPVRLEVDFDPAAAEPARGQERINASNMDFFTDLNKYIPAGEPQLGGVRVEQILSNPAVLDRFDTLVLAEDFMPGFFVEDPDPPFEGEPQETIEFSFPIATGGETFEFDVLGPPEVDNDLMTVTTTWEIPSDWDVTVERQREDGTWEDRGCQCAFVNNGEQLLVTAPEPGRWRVRVDNFLAAPQPVEGTIEFTADAAIPGADENRYTPQQFDQYASAIARFTGEGGNLVLTDGALRGAAVLGLVDPLAVDYNQPGGRGAVPRYEMNIAAVEDEEENEISPARGNLCTPDSPDPLLRDVCLPGTAGGTARQGVEPVPLGYTPDATLDGVRDAKLTQWFVERIAWETGCHKPTSSECTSALLGTGVGLGERAYGDGVVRIAGAMLPDPNFSPGGPRDMRFGLESYALTFSGWQIFLNLVDYQRPAAPGPDCTITGTEAADVIDGTAGDDVICGGAGGDTIRGLGGNDALYGGAGFDRLNGGPGTDQCFVEADGGSAKYCES